MELWWAVTSAGIPGWYFLICISFTTLFLLISLQQLCITRIHHYKKLWCRLLTAIWCILATILNLLQIYSYHDDSFRVMIWLRALTGFGIIIGIFTTYQFVIGIVDSVYLYRTKYAVSNAPKWFKDTWRIILLFDMISLFILYGAAFSRQNAIFFDVHFICIGTTFWIGSLSILIAILHINRFLNNTIYLVSEAAEKNNINTSIFTASLSSHHDIYDSNGSIGQQQRNRTISNETDFKQQAADYNTLLKIKKLKKFRFRLIFIVICGIGLIVPITVYTISMFKHLIYSNKIHHDIKEQPYPNMFYYSGFATFLNCFDVQLLSWTFTLRNGFINSGHNLFCKLFCCEKCFNLRKLPIVIHRKRNASISDPDSSDFTATHSSIIPHKNPKITDLSHLTTSIP